jgi:outer membrane protein TolC
MHHNPIPRVLAGIALSTLVLGSVVPVAAQTTPTATQPGAPSSSTTSTSTTPRTSLTPAPAITPSALNGTPSSARTPIPSGTSPANAPGSPNQANTLSGGNAAISADALPTLQPADQTTPLPYPAYGTPAPVTRGVTPPANVPQIITLQQAILIAYAMAPSLAQARGAIGVANGAVITAEGQLTPSLSGTGTITRSHGSATSSSITSSGGIVGGGGTATVAPSAAPSVAPTAVATGAGTTTTTQTSGAYGNSDTTSVSLGVTLRQLIFDGGRVLQQIHEARANQIASVQTYQRQLQTVAYNVATAYYNALNAERQVAVDTESVRIDIVNENLVNASIRAGTEAKADLSTAQLSTSQARVAVIRAQATELTDLATFANTLGIDANYNVQPKDDVPALSASSGTLKVTPGFPTPTYTVALARANALRPDLAAQQSSVNSEIAALRAARLGRVPTLYGDATYGIASTNGSGGDFKNSWTIGATLTIPILDQGATHGAVVSAQGSLDEGNATLLNLQQQVQLGIKTALVNLVSAYSALDQTNAELSKAQDVLRSTQAQYRAGVTTLPLLLNAQVGITQALTDEVTAAYAVRQAEQALLYAEGANGAG